jgi:hypothetical protein
MADNKSLLSILTWIVGIFVSLAVGDGMRRGVLTITGIPDALTAIAGWVVIVGAIISVVLALFNK